MKTTAQNTEMHCTGLYGDTLNWVVTFIETISTGMNSKHFTGLYRNITLDDGTEEHWIITHIAKDQHLHWIVCLAADIYVCVCVCGLCSALRDIQR